MRDNGGQGADNESITTEHYRRAACRVERAASKHATASRRGRAPLFAWRGAAMSVQDGMPCPNCGRCQSAVVVGRPRDNRIWRKRLCRECGTRWTTYELSESALAAIERDAHDRAIENVRSALGLASPISGGA